MRDKWTAYNIEFGICGVVVGIVLLFGQFLEHTHDSSWVGRHSLENCFVTIKTPVT